MTITRPKLTFADYLKDDDSTENRCEFIDGVLVELPPESESNNWIALNLRDVLIRCMQRRLVRCHQCEVQVPVLQMGDAQNRFPDVVILQHSHLALTQKRLTITLEMPPPQLIAKVVSPGAENRDRDCNRKRAQYAAIGVPEYWLIDPENQWVMVLILHQGVYEQHGLFQSEERVQSPLVPGLSITAAQLLSGELD